MSADNWANCPKCLERYNAKKIKEKEKLAESYGKIPAEEYLKKVEQVNAPPSQGEIGTELLREDYEFYMSGDGVFEASYHCKCNRCGFKHEFKHSELIEITP